MPNPKKHHSNMRTRMRRSQWKVAVPNTIRCPQCGSYKLSHRICPNCGYYKGVEVVDVLKKLTKKERKKREKEMKAKEAEEREKTREKPLSWEELSKR